ncbi:hypothetical protein Pelo_5608 [Pelomyxa schiedti]|nr:hypothetical protein Pelo_5608 [Pelomyxa schiedti]
MFGDFVVSAVGKNDPNKQTALKYLLSAFGSTPESFSRTVAELQGALQTFKSLQSSFVSLAKFGSQEMIVEALRSGVLDPKKPATHNNDITYPITEAVRRGDPLIVHTLLSANVPVLVTDQECAGGCGVGSVRRVSPLAEALLAKNAQICLMVIAVHPDLTKDSGYFLNSTFEPSAEMNVFDLARAWGHPDVLRQMKLL